MAFDIQGLGRLSSTMNENSMIVWSYKSTTDTLATISSAGYFASLSTKLRLGDKIFIEASDSSDVVRISSLSPVSTESTSSSSFTLTGNTDAASAFGARPYTIYGSTNGNMVTLSWKQVITAPTQSADIRISGLTGDWLPALQVDAQVTVFDNSIEKVGQVQIDFGGLIIFSNGPATATPFTFPGGNVGFSSGTITYDKRV